MPKVEPRPNDALLTAVTRELARHDPAVAQGVLDALVEYGTDGDDLDERVWGPAPSLNDVAEAEVATARLLELARHRVLADTLTRKEAAARLGVGQQRISRLVETGDLVALERNGQLRLPAWQFHPDTPKGRLDGIRVVAAALVAGPVELSQWMSRPNPALGGASPAKWLRVGDVDSVLAAARSGA